MQKYHDEPKQYKGYLKSALALLRLLGHRGSYRNRTTAERVGQVEPVPWSGRSLPSPVERRAL